MKLSLPFLYLTVFISGMTTLAVEMSASRLLGSVFGTSNIVWANVIGLILIYLTAGYFIGGRLADRRPSPPLMFTLILWGAFLSAIIPLIARPILQAAAEAFVNVDGGLALGSFIAVLILFSAPITLLGTVSPFAIRLAVTTVENAGRISGQIYAVSTVGSIIGTFSSVLFTIPELGTIRTFLLFSGILFVLAFVGLFRFNQKRAILLLWMPVAVAILAYVVMDGPLRAPADNAELLLEDESAYNYIQVQEDDQGYRYLYLNEGQGIHSQWHPTEVFYDRTWDYFLTAPYFNDNFQPDDMQSVLIIGLATGTIPRQHIAVYGNLPMDGIEIDPAIISAGEQYFDMNTDKMPSLTTHAEDGRYGLKQLQDHRYTVVAIDAYKPPYIPFHLTTVEYFQEIKDLLTEDGVVAINVGRTPTDRRFVDAMTNTLLKVYPSVHAMDVPRSLNTILVATQDETSSENLAQNLSRLNTIEYPDLAQVMENGINAIVTTVTNDVVFTDDRAPVETIVDSLVLGFLLEGGAEALR